MVLDYDQDAVERNKKIFYDRIDNLVRHIEESLKYKKQVMEEAKEAEKAQAANKKKNSGALNATMRMNTKDLMPLPENPKD